MQSANQLLLHLTSRGSTVRKLGAGVIGKFINQSNQPIRDVNRFGLLHYSIPKVLDFLSEENRKFTIRFTYRNGTQHNVRVILPLMDYYSITEDRAQEAIAFTEILQTSINWAIQKEWGSNSGANQAVVNIMAKPGECFANRLGCIVQRANNGRLQFIFGYRGAKDIEEEKTANNEDVWVYKNSVVMANTGTPVPCVAENAMPNRHYFAGVAASTSGYAFVDTNGQHIQQNPWANNPPVDLMEKVGLQLVEFVEMGQRLQLLLGVDGSGVSSGQDNWFRYPVIDQVTGNPVTEDGGQDPKVLAWQRGRILLVNYQGTAAVVPANTYARVGMIEVTMPVPPNLFPPSFMFLQLVTQGTRSKVLGHDAERGGWSVPCSSNQFRSKYDNFPGTQSPLVDEAWDPNNVRTCPAILNRGEKNRHAAKDFVYEGEFDSLPYGADQTVVGTVTELHNFSLDHNAAFANGGAVLTNHRFGSRMIHYGDKLTMTALAQTAGRSEKQFGRNTMVQAPTFTVSMIDPNWIYTDVPNNTLQDVTIQIMWGDTNENVTDICANPVQFTMIASQ